MNTEGKELRYSEHLRIGILRSEEPFVSAVPGELDAEDMLAYGVFSLQGELDAGEQIYLTVLLWMPTDTANTAAAGAVTPRFEVGCELYAAQVPSESDSFDSDYVPENAPLPDGINSGT